jgi:GntR family trehalose operon transcriptional repressor
LRRRSMAKAPSCFRPTRSSFSSAASSVSRRPTRAWATTSAPLEGALLEHIHAEPGSLITRIKRVRRIDGKRVILDINHFVSDVIPGLSLDIAEQSIYAHIEQTLQLQIAYAQRTIEAVPRSKDDQLHLDLDGQSHVIVVSNQTFLQDGRQFEYTESRHTLDKFYFSDVARR